MTLTRMFLGVTVALVIGACGDSGTGGARSPEEGAADEEVAALEATIAALETGDKQNSESGSAANTPPGSILAPGEVWLEDGFSLQLERTEPRLDDWRENGPGVVVKFELTNRTGTDLPVSYSQNNFAAEDQDGNRLEFGQLHGAHSNFKSIGLTEEMLTDRQSMPVPSGNFWLFLKGDVSDPSFESVLVTTRGLGRITEARWRIPVAH